MTENEINELRFIGGACAICGGESLPSRLTATLVPSKNYPGRKVAESYMQEQLVCEEHRSLRVWALLEEEFARSVLRHPDAHLFYHAMGFSCPDCVICTGCEESVAREGDYFCAQCRFGF